MSMEALIYARNRFSKWRIFIEYVESGMISSLSGRYKIPVKTLHNVYRGIGHCRYRHDVTAMLLSDACVDIIQCLFRYYTLTYLILVSATFLCRHQVMPY